MNIACEDAPMSDTDLAGLETITYDERGAVAWITLNRPEVHNAFDSTMCREIHEVWRALRKNDDVNCAVLTAAGDQAFCVGMDRGEPGVFTVLENERAIYATSNNFMYDDPGEILGPKASDLWKPVICAVNGMACGGAFYLIAESDIIIAAENATFFDPHVTYGMAAVYEPIKMLQHMPLGEVLRMSLVGNHERISAATALRIGLVSEIVPVAELEATASRIADAVASAPGFATAGTLRAIWAANDLGRLGGISIAPSILTTGTDTIAFRSGAESFDNEPRITPRIR